MILALSVPIFKFLIINIINPITASDPPTFLEGRALAVRKCKNLLILYFHYKLALIYNLRSENF